MENFEDEIISWQNVTNLDENSLCGVIEALIFISDRPISLVKIREQIHELIPLKIIHECIKKIQSDCEREHRGIRLMEVAEGVTFRTKTAYASFVQKLNKMTTIQLPPPALEVLSIIAYHGPITKPDIEKIKGTDSSHYLRMLMEKRLISIQGKTEGAGNPSLYGTTSEFLEFFNLNSLQDLPKLHEIELLANAQEVGDIKEIQELRRFIHGSETSMSELKEFEELDHEIKAIQTNTSFTKILNKKPTESLPENKKSTFELMEEYLQLLEIKNQNILAAESFYHPEWASNNPVAISPEIESFKNSFFESPDELEFTEEETLQNDELEEELEVFEDSFAPFEAKKDHF